MTAKLNAATAAASPWEQATLSINDNKVEWGAELVLLRGQENDVTVEAPPGIARAINLGLAEGGGLTIGASPDFGDWVAPVGGKFNWKITPDAGKSGRVTLVFFSREVEVPWEHRSLVISSNLADEATVLIDGRPVPENGADFFWGRPRELTLEVDPDSPVAILPISLNWVSGMGVARDDLDVSPELEEPQTEYKWTITGRPTNTGTFNMAFVAKDLPVPLSLESCRLVDRLTYKVLIDGQEHKPGVDVVYPVRDKNMLITLMPESGSKNDPVFSLKRPSYSGIAESTPAFGLSVPVGVDGHTWRVNFSGHDRPFILEFDGMQSIALDMYPGYHSSDISLTRITSTTGGSTRIIKVTVLGGYLLPRNVRVSWEFNGKIWHSFSGLDGVCTTEIVHAQTGLFSAWVYVQGERHSVQQIRF
ncbi:hypothetical protein EMIT0196MI5_100133 [Pseudomonas sp. IT-196MI5]|uniref:hypothetical protein n=1 Tax=unclassified Pseudomonas TaxID=196821 RepID=UPI0039E0DD9E